jgi:hypothetical protein
MSSNVPISPSRSSAPYPQSCLTKLIRPRSTCQRTAQTRKSSPASARASTSTYRRKTRMAIMPSARSRSRSGVTSRTDSWSARSWSTLGRAEKARRSRSGSVRYHELCLFHGRIFFGCGGRRKSALDGARCDVIRLGGDTAFCTTSLYRNILSSSAPKSPPPTPPRSACPLNLTRSALPALLASVLALKLPIDALVPAPSVS